MRPVWMLQWGTERCCYLSVCHVVREVGDDDVQWLWWRLIKMKMMNE